jgi:hypothetical protein
MISRTKTKLELFSTPGIYWVLVDLLRQFDKEHTTASANDEYYLLQIYKLKNKYENEILDNKRGNSKQLYLEDSIKEVKDVQA